ncbi:MAG: hypothetical protein K2X93_02740 [Candidatus Obscuribacterales bacterium]|nr:hypothetical protein [Candidatus Obscuribacterales bacterium]
MFSQLGDIFVLGGFSIFLYGVCVAVDRASPFLTIHPNVVQAVIVCTWLINYPHYTATYHRAYRSMGEVKRHPIVAIWLPAIMLALLAATFVFPSALGGWYCKAYFLTVAYHYAGQSYGISLIFCRRAGIDVNKFFRVCLGLPIYSSAILYIIGDELMVHRNSFLGIEMPMFHYPFWSYLLAYFGVAIGCVVYIAMTVYQRSISEKVPLVVHIIVLAQLIWFTVGMRLELFLLLVPTLHCLQYLLITTYVRFREESGEGKLSAKSANQFFKTGQFWKYYGLLITGGLLLFIGIPYLISFLKLATFQFGNAIVYSFVNLHHFLLDGEIWKLRKNDIGKAIAPSGSTL